MALPPSACRTRLCGASLALSTNFNETLPLRARWEVTFEPSAPAPNTTVGSAPASGSMAEILRAKAGVSGVRWSDRRTSAARSQAPSFGQWSPLANTRKFSSSRSDSVPRTRCGRRTARTIGTPPKSWRPLARKKSSASSTGKPSSAAHFRNSPSVSGSSPKWRLEISCSGAHTRSPNRRRWNLSLCCVSCESSFRILATVLCSSTTASGTKAAWRTEYPLVAISALRSSSSRSNAKMPAPAAPASSFQCLETSSIIASGAYTNVPNVSGERVDSKPSPSGTSRLRAASRSQPRVRSTRSTIVCSANQASSDPRCRQNDAGTFGPVGLRCGNAALGKSRRSEWTRGAR